MKLCAIFNFASHYRWEIYSKIDKTFDTKFLFGEKLLAKGTEGIEGLKPELFKDANYVQNKKVFSEFYWQSGVLGYIRKDYDRYLMVGEPFCLSTWALMIVSKFYKNKKVFLWTHGWYGRESFIRKIIKKTFFKLADGILTYGNYARNLMIEEGFSSNKIDTIYNSLEYSTQLKLRAEQKETDIYKNIFKHDNKTIVFIGRLTKQKQLDLLLDALATLKDKGKNYNLCLIGNGEELENLKAKTKDLKLQDNVNFYGACYDEATTAELLYNADVCVSVGNVGLTAIHALSFGCPVITHNNFPMQMPEFESIKEGETGFFFEYNNIDSLAEKIELCLSLDRDSVRQNSYKEIDSLWNPNNQIEILKRNLLG